MVTALAIARHLVPAPTMNDMKFATRGFPVTADDVSRRLEGVSRAVMEGFEYGADIADSAEVVRRLEWVDPRYRGLAYEGAIAAMTIRDVLAFGVTTRAESFVRGPAEPHSLLAYIGYGLVMSRLPKFMWRRALPRFDSNPLAAKLSWLAVDGYGFDRAFFDPKRWIEGRERAAHYAWEGAPEYFPRAFDQGIGRAVVFVFGGDCVEIARVVTRFDDERGGDVWSGVAAALAYMGGPSRAELAALLRAAGPYAPDLAVGAVMAIKARHYAGYVPDNSELAAEVFCQGTVDEIAALAASAADSPGDPAGPPEYFQWRDRIRAHYVANCDVAVVRSP